jgi:lincosamide nucleotidyltransferase A/C/D/E
MTKPLQDHQAVLPGDHVMTAEDVVELLELLRDNGADVCVGGGWAIDALFGEQTREHSDLDIWLPTAQFERSIIAFSAVAVDRLLPWPDHWPWNFVLHDGARRRVDLHLYEPLTEDSIHYGSTTEGITFPAAALHGQGSITGMPVICESPEWLVRWHTGYPIRPVDRHDIGLICSKFGVPLPDEYR